MIVRRSVVFDRRVEMSHHMWARSLGTRFRTTISSIISTRDVTMSWRATSQGKRPPLFPRGDAPGGRLTRGAVNRSPVPLSLPFPKAYGCASGWHPYLHRGIGGVTAGRTYAARPDPATGDVTTFPSSQEVSHGAGHHSEHRLEQAATHSLRCDGAPHAPAGPARP